MQVQVYLSNHHSFCEESPNGVCLCYEMTGYQDFNPNLMLINCCHHKLKVEIGHKGIPIQLIRKKFVMLLIVCLFISVRVYLYKTYKTCATHIV